MKRKAAVLYQCLKCEKNYFTEKCAKTCNFECSRRVDWKEELFWYELELGRVSKFSVIFWRKFCQEIFWVARRYFAPNWKPETFRVISSDEQFDCHHNCETCEFEK
jgi:hypothetical protein